MIESIPPAAVRAVQSFTDRMDFTLSPQEEALVARDRAQAARRVHDRAGLRPRRPHRARRATRAARTRPPAGVLGCRGQDLVTAVVVEKD
ncbi:hypothetical protein [Streptomyces sp. NBC_01255]|uniref:hypothetical protein n=1 Tax=Streptomyces sp. NBC_01255 TaxID=2903798 RepID=UPI003FCD7CDC